MKRISPFILAVAAFVFTVASASAITLYGTAYINGGPATLYTIDSTTGIGTPLGLTGFSQISAIDFDPLTGILYGEGYDPNQSSRFLLSINTTTGMATSIGMTGLETPFNDISF